MNILNILNINHTTLNTSFQGILKEAENKQMIVDTLEKRVGNMQNELETSEQQQLEDDTKALRGEHIELRTILQEEISIASAAVDACRKFEIDLARARTWIKNKSNELKKLSGYLPLKASKVEQEITQHSSLESEIASFNEGNLNDIIKQGHNMLKECNAEDRAKLQALLDDLNKNYEELKKEGKEKQASLNDLLQGRKSFENEMDKCQRWINEAEVATSLELRTSSVDVLREQLAKVFLIFSTLATLKFLFVTLYIYFLFILLSFSVRSIKKRSQRI